MRAGFPDFRLGNVLATSFTGTLTERRGNAVERIPTPQRLVDWLAVNGLAVNSCTTAQLELARELRESIHAAATATAIQDALPASAIQIINDCSIQGRAAAILTPEGNRRWRLSSASCVEDALGVIAATRSASSQANETENWPCVHHQPAKPPSSTPAKVAPANGVT